MAKGNIFMGTVKGRIGDTVLYVSGGQQNITKYQPNITNPQTGRQMYQRARFANAGRFFTRGQQNFYKFAFENKKPGVSDFNAFMQANINRSVLISKSALAVDGYPAIGKFIMSRGSLSSVTCRVVNDYWQAHFGIAEQSTNPTTVGELATLLISTGNYQRGDILTFVFLNTTGSGYIPSVKPTGEYRTNWILKQFQLNPGDTTPLANYEMRAARRVWNDIAYMTLTDLEDSQVLYSTDSAFTVVHSRNTRNGLKVSTQELALGETMQIAYDECQTDEYKEQVIADWKSTDIVNVAPEAILEGSLSWQQSDYEGISISLGDDSPFTLNGWQLNGIGRIISDERYIAAVFRGNGITAENFRAVAVESPAANIINFNDDGGGVVEMELISTGEGSDTNIYRIQYYSDGDWHSVAHMEFSFAEVINVTFENNGESKTLVANFTASWGPITPNNAIPLSVGDKLSYRMELKDVTSAITWWLTATTNSWDGTSTSLSSNEEGNPIAAGSTTIFEEGTWYIRNNRVDYLMVFFENQSAGVFDFSVTLLSLIIEHSDGTSTVYVVQR